MALIIHYYIEKKKAAGEERPFCQIAIFSCIHGFNFRFNWFILLAVLRFAGRSFHATDDLGTKLAKVTSCLLQSPPPSPTPVASLVG